MGGNKCFMIIILWYIHKSLCYILKNNIMSYTKYISVEKLRGFLGGAVAKNMPANAGDAREWVWSLGLEDPL